MHLIPFCILQQNVLMAGMAWVVMNDALDIVNIIKAAIM